MVILIPWAEHDVCREPVSLDYFPIAPMTSFISWPAAFIS